MPINLYGISYTSKIIPAVGRNNIFFLGDWKPPMIKNPAYKGRWVHPEIDNPDYAADDQIYAYDDFGRIGLDLWQVCYVQIVTHLTTN